MKETKGCNTVDFVVGLAVGVLAGVAVGLLWAPRSGSESRHKLSEGFRDARDKTHKYLETTRHGSEETLQQVKTMVEQKFNLLLEAVNAGKRAAAKTKNKLQTAQSNGSESESGDK